MKLGFTPRGWTDYVHWQDSDPDLLARINALIRDALRTAFSGIGKPEPLLGEMKGWWSRRITGGHRLVYRVSGSGEAQVLEIASCRYHYR